MSSGEPKTKRKFIMGGRVDSVENLLREKMPFDALTEDDREFIFSSYVELDSISSDMLAYIAIKTKKQETLEKALKHSKVIIDWISVIKNIRYCYYKNKKLIINKLKEQFDEIVQMDAGFDFFFKICYLIVIESFYIEAKNIETEDGYFDQLLNIILNYLEKNLDDEETLINFSYSSFDFSSDKSNYLLMLFEMISYISCNPHSSIDTSNRAISFMGNLKEKCRNIGDANHIFIKFKDKFTVENLTEYFITFFGDYCNDCCNKVDSFDSKYGLFGRRNIYNPNEVLSFDEKIRSYSHTQALSNALLGAMLRNSDYEWHSVTLKAVVDFVFHDSTTEDMIKKVLLDRIDSFCVSKEENGKETIQLDNRIDALFEAIVTDERFEQKALPFELLDKMVKLSKKDIVFVNCYKKSKSKEFEKIILDKVLSDKIPIDELNNHDFPKEIMDIFWRGREEIGISPQGVNIYGVMIGNKYTTEDVLMESFMKLGDAYKSPRSLLPVILNPNFDEKFYKFLVCWLKKSNGYPFISDYDIVLLNEEPDTFANYYIKNDGNQLKDWYLSELVCEVIFGSVEMYELVKEESVIQFLSQFDDKSKEYKDAYYRLLNLVPSKEKDSFGKK